MLLLLLAFSAPINGLKAIHSKGTFDNEAAKQCRDGTGHATYFSKLLKGYYHLNLLLQTEGSVFRMSAADIVACYGGDRL